MEKKLNVLLIDDDEEDFIITKHLIHSSPGSASESRDLLVDLDWIENYDAALYAIENQLYDAYLVDYRLGQHTGLDLLKKAVEMGCKAPIILLTGQGSYEVDLAAMEAGAADYLVKDEISASLLERSIRYAIERTQAQEDLKKAHAELEALHAATAALLQTLDLDILLGQILDAAQSALPHADKGLVHLVTPETGKLEVRAMLGETGSYQLNRASISIDPRIKRLRVSCIEDNLAHFLQEQKPVLIRDTHLSKNWRYSGCGEEWNGARSILISPLVLNQKLIGAISLVASLPRALTEQDLRILNTFAMTATAAINNAILHREVQQQAITDPLTLVYNRRGFFEVGEREFERYLRDQRPLSAVMLDLDYFKEINDTRGHQQGDQVLIALADRIRQYVRKIDVIGRYGGDEFILLLPETDMFTARGIAERLRRSVAETPLLDTNPPMQMTISAGIAEAGPGVSGLSSLIGLADSALYKAKSDGRNCSRTF